MEDEVLLNEEISEAHEDIKEEEISNEETVEDTTEVLDEEKPKTKRELRREKKYERLYKLFSRPDIKYRGPLAYYHLRIIAWISIALAQIVGIMALCSKYGIELMSDGTQSILGRLSSLSLPLFLIAVFATILNKNKTYKAVVIFYAVAYVGMGLLFLLIYYRYINSILVRVLPEASTLLENLIYDKGFKLNIFSDLLVLSLFNFFINYTPEKHFKCKKVYIFRLLSIIPLLFALVSYILNVLGGFDLIKLPIWVFPFLTTKSPLVYVLFIILSIWIKKRERLFLKIGFTKEEYHAFLKTNRNSLSFSLKTCSALFIVSILDVFFLLLALILGALTQNPVAFSRAATVFKAGDCLGLFFAIPIILLFSYTRSTKNKNTDLFVALGGVALIGIVYLESLYQILYQVIINLGIENIPIPGLG